MGNITTDNFMNNIGSPTNVPNPTSPMRPSVRNAND